MPALRIGVRTALVVMSVASLMGAALANPRFYPLLVAVWVSFLAWHTLRFEWRNERILIFVIGLLLTIFMVFGAVVKIPAR